LETEFISFTYNHNKLQLLKITSLTGFALALALEFLWDQPDQLASRTCLSVLRRKVKRTQDCDLLRGNMLIHYHRNVTLQPTLYLLLWGNFTPETPLLVPQERLFHNSDTEPNMSQYGLIEVYVSG
jgi:hypothetical protein